LNLPFRDESLDAVLSVAVIHHVATAERRVRALRELARVVRVGGRVMISVWAMEQRHRKVRHHLQLRDITIICDTFPDPLVTFFKITVFQTSML
jgi:ubiquinone/menaquinone biosynthesis C-methylase UbiE